MLSTPQDATECRRHARRLNAKSPLLPCHIFSSSYSPVIADAKGLVGLSNTALVARALVLVAADFLVLTLALLHECRKLSVVVLGNGLGRHLDLAVAARFRDVLLDIDDGLLEAGDTDRLVETLRGED
jgi:hypothetical protein